jgi:hypothetical protein
VADLIAYRRAKLLQDFDVKGKVGVEIGALNHPILTRDIADVIYVDHATTPELRKKYGHDPAVDIANIVDVDAVWGDNTLREAIGRDRKVDYIVASHVIEHVPDLIGWLTELGEVLQVGGNVRLLVPDKRFTFDILRRETEISDVLNASLLKARKPLASCILDCQINWREVDVAKAWNGELQADTLPQRFGVHESFQRAKDAVDNDKYQDAHCWVFTPKSMARLFEQLAEADMINFACSKFQDTPQNELEFMVVLEKSTDKKQIIESWQTVQRTAREHTKGTALGNALEELSKTQAELKQAKQQIAALEASTSWRLTQPLRSVLSRIKQ